MVYPGAHHTRFHHAIGSMHLMMKTLDNLRNKGHHIWDIEYESACLAILLHDVGHGPFSHALEHTMLKKVPHEYISLTIMEYLNQKFEGKLRVAIDMFKNKYHRPFFYQLISSQLDMDRLDYLRRDCYFTGVSEGTVASERIIKMMDLVEDELVVEEKGIYSIENFLNARRLMYWQVYLHKTAVSAEQMLISCISRAQDLAQEGKDIFASPGLGRFLKQKITIKELKSEVLEDFMELDDMDVWGAIKVWVHYPDYVLATLSKNILNRNISKIELRNEAPTKEELDAKLKEIENKFGLKTSLAKYFLSTGVISNKAYISKGQSIKIKTKNNQLLDIAEASDLPNIKAISKIVKKYYISYPKVLDL
jgi:HD superfamily phosphohydrolase